MKQSKKWIYAITAVFMSACVCLLSGCGKKEDGAWQTGAEGQYEGPAVQAEDIPARQETLPGESAKETGIMRAYSEEEREHMEELKQAYENETAKPEKMIQEVESADQATEGELSYIRSTGEYCLPDRDLTDEELLEIIDCNFRIAFAANRKTKEEYDAEDREKRAMLEEKVQTAGGISEEEAIEIGRKAMEADLGGSGKNLKLRVYDEAQGWNTELCVADWSEIKEEDRGAIAWSMQFDPGNDTDDWTNYHCTVNAADGSILEAYQIEFTSEDVYSGNAVYYEH